jgi:hypothetical protein
MKDLLVKKFERISAGLDRVVANESAKEFAKRSASMISAYDNMVICQDCNNADAEAKRLAGAHSSFSYSPNEIKAFIIVAPNKEHEIDKESVPLEYHSDHIKKLAENVAQRWGAVYALYVLCGPTRQQPQRDAAHWRTKVRYERVRAPSAGEIEHVAPVMFATL